MRLESPSRPFMNKQRSSKCHLRLIFSLEKQSILNLQKQIKNINFWLGRHESLNNIITHKIFKKKLLVLPLPPKCSKRLDFGQEVSGRIEDNLRIILVRGNMA